MSSREEMNSTYEQLQAAKAYLAEKLQDAQQRMQQETPEPGAASAASLGMPESPVADCYAPAPPELAPIIMDTDPSPLVLMHSSPAPTSPPSIGVAGPIA